MPLGIGAFAIGLSGFAAAQTRLRSSAHNVANLLTRDFRPQRVHQVARAEGGVLSHLQTARTPRAVDTLREFIDQRRALLQGRASLRVIDSALSLERYSIDLFA